MEFWGVFGPSFHSNPNSLVLSRENRNVENWSWDEEYADNQSWNWEILTIGWRIGVGVSGIPGDMSFRTLGDSDNWRFGNTKVENIKVEIEKWWRLENVSWALVNWSNWILGDLLTN
jgi:hypothetical protein